MDILVLSPCSARKQYDRVLDCEVIDERPLEQLIGEFPNHVAPAAELYTGAEHGFIQTGVSRLRDIANVDWKIISGGYGLLDENTRIPSYECSFSRQNIDSVRTRARRAGYDVDELTNDETIQAVGQEKRIPQDFRESLSRGYDVLFVLLSEPYLLTITEVLTNIPDRTMAFVFAPKGSKHLIGGCNWVPATDTERKALETTRMKLKGMLFREFASQVRQPQLQNIQTNPDLVHSLSMGEG